MIEGLSALANARELENQSFAQLPQAVVTRSKQRPTLFEKVFIGALYAVLTAWITLLGFFGFMVMEPVL